MHQSTKFLMAATLWISVAGTALAQWTTQTVPLRSGWNAVHLQVQPEPRDCENVFAKMPIESVWMWNGHFSSAQYIRNPDELIPEDPAWLAYLPATHPMASRSDLFAILGGKTYLIRVTANVSNFNWVVTGQPVVRSPQWLSDSMNFVGFPIDPLSYPTFTSFFASSPAHQSNAVFRLDLLGHWAQVSNPAGTAMRPGEAFWIKTTGNSDFAGPTRILLDVPDRIDFGRVVIEQTVRIRNDSGNNATYTIRMLPSAPPPTGSAAPLAGPVALSYWDDNLSGQHYGWFEFRNPLTFQQIAPKKELRLRLAVRRNDMVPSGSTVGGDALYQSLLEIRDGAGTCRSLIPVVARGLERPETGWSSNGRTKDPSMPSLRGGLWVGSAVINAVSYAGDPSDIVTPRATASQMQFRLILHIDDTGRARLLQHVTLMFQKGSTTEEAGAYVLVSEDALLPQFEGVAVRGGEAVGRRISSSCFGFDRPQLMTPVGGESLECTVVMGYDDPLNPFKHRFHPDHNNLDESYRFVLKENEGAEAYRIQRKIQLTFTPQDQSGQSQIVAGWNDDQVGGYYRETIEGIHKNPIVVSGLFRLHQACRIAQLQDSRLN